MLLQDLLHAFDVIGLSETRIKNSKIKDVILGVEECPTLNYLIIIDKLYLWDCRRNGVLPNLTCFQAKVNIKIQTESTLV